MEANLADFESVCSIGFSWGIRDATGTAKGHASRIPRSCQTNCVVRSCTWLSFVSVNMIGRRVSNITWSTLKVCTWWLDPESKSILMLSINPLICQVQGRSRETEILGWQWLTEDCVPTRKHVILTFLSLQTCSWPVARRNSDADQVSGN